MCENMALVALTTVKEEIVIKKTFYKCALLLSPLYRCVAFLSNAIDRG